MHVRSIDAHRPTARFDAAVCCGMVKKILLLVMVLLGGAAGGDAADSGAAERADLPIEALEAGANVVFVGICERIEEKSARSGGFEDTTYFHHMRVERLCRDSSGKVKVGGVVAVISATHHWVAGGLPPTYGSGHRGMPAKGERRRVYCRYDATNQGKGSTGLHWLQALEPNGWQAPARSVVFVAADDEYKSEETLPKLGEWLQRDYEGVVAPVQAFAADPATGKPDVTRRDHIANLDKLDNAEAAVVFMRWRDLSAPDWSHFERFLMSGRPIVGLRTSTHMMRTGKQSLDVDLPVRVFGQKWITHAGSDTRTRVLKPDSDHPIVRGMKGDFVVRGWLYEVQPLPADCTVLLWGEVEGGDGSMSRQPLVWVREATKDTVRPFGDRGTPARRMAFTTLGHPEDFENEEVRGLLERMVLWACGEENVLRAR
jgi:hypothetical protein